MFSFLFKNSSEMPIKEVQSISVELPSRTELFDKALEEAKIKIAYKEINAFLFKEIYGDDVYKDTIGTMRDFANNSDWDRKKHPKCHFRHGVPSLDIYSHEIMTYLAKKAVML